MKALPLLLCLSVLAISAVGLWPTAPNNSVPTPATSSPLVTGNFTAESRWAEGLLRAVQQTHGAAEASTDRGALLDALDAADHKAPVYVSIALHQSGDWEPFPSLDRLRRELDRRAGVLSPRLSELATRSAPRDRLTKHLLNSLAPALERFRTTADLDDNERQLAELFTRSDACARLCLEAAVTEDPACVFAWTELASRGDTMRRMTAAQAWQTLEPDNAAAWYMAALAHHASGNDKAALDALTTGNTKSNCRFPSEFIPTQFDVEIPTDPTVADSVQAHLTPVGLSNLLQLDVAGRSAPHPVANLHRLALELAETVAQAQRSDHSERVGTALRRLGTQLMTGTPPSATQVRHGVSILQLGAGLSGAVDSQSALSGYDFHLQRTTRELSSGLARWNERARSLLEDRAAILSGQVNLRQEEELAMRKLLSQPLLQPVLAENSIVDAASLR